MKSELEIIFIFEHIKKISWKIIHFELLLKKNSRIFIFIKHFFYL